MVKNNNRKQKRGQMTLWVIIAIFLVIMIVLLFMTLKKSPIIKPVETINPEPIIDSCVKEAVDETVDKILPQGGFVEPNNYKEYNKTKISYLCKNEGNFKPCIMQHPNFMYEVNQEIYKDVEGKIEGCFQSMKTGLEERSMSVDLSAQNVTVFLEKGKIDIKILRRVIMQKDDFTQEINEFKSEIKNPLYDLVKVAIEIANQEALYCNFEYLGYMLTYPQFKITKITASDSTKIYAIEDIKSKKKLNIAIRGCAIPHDI